MKTRVSDVTKPIIALRNFANAPKMSEMRYFLIFWCVQLYVKGTFALFYAISLLKCY